METNEIIEGVLGIIAMIGSLWLTGRIFKNSPFSILRRVSDVAEKGTTDILRNNKKRQHHEPVKVQTKFGSRNSSTITPKRPSKINWDLPSVEDIGQEEKLQRDKLKSASSRGERDFIKSSGNKIKSFKEFVNPEKLQLDLGKGRTLLHDLVRGKFIVDDVEYGAQIDNVTGLKLIGNSRIDGNPIVQIKVAGENPLLVKVNYPESRFELIKNPRNHISPDVTPQKSNINSYWDSGIPEGTTNSKYY